MTYHEVAKLIEVVVEVAVRVVPEDDLVVESWPVRNVAAFSFEVGFLVAQLMIVLADDNQLVVIWHQCQ